MSIAWQAVDDQVQMLARLFLALFVLIGLLPHFQKSFSRWHDYILSLRRPRSPGLAALITELEVAPAEPARMNDIEYILFTRLSQRGAKGVSLAALAKDLHLEGVLVRRALQSLHQRGLVRIMPGLVFGRRFSLSEEGLSLAIAEGFTPRLSRPVPNAASWSAYRPESPQ
jgi:hypothetical protein